MTPEDAQEAFRAVLREAGEAIDMPLSASASDEEHLYVGQTVAAWCRLMRRVYFAPGSHSHMPYVVGKKSND